MGKLARVCGVAVLLLTACNTPAPRAWLRYQPNGPHSWAAGPDGRWLTRLHGVDIAMELNLVQTRVQVTVTNATSAPVEMRMCPEAASPKEAIGEVLLRPIDGPPGVPGPEMAGYVVRQPVGVAAGWRATFFLDRPLGREPSLGQSFVLTVEAKDQAGEVERRSMPLVATNAGTMPLDRP